MHDVSFQSTEIFRYFRFTARVCLELFDLMQSCQCFICYDVGIERGTEHMIQAIFFDMDGTLISFQTHEIDPRTFATLQKLKDHGIRLLSLRDVQRRPWCPA